jgi:hypothetical protein
MTFYGGLTAPSHYPHAESLFGNSAQGAPGGNRELPRLRSTGYAAKRHSHPVTIETTRQYAMWQIAT